MARKGNIKGVEATGGKSRGTKRIATDEILVSLRKRQKVQSSPGLEIQDQPKQDQITLRVQDQVFRFMDLPAELRNRVYEYAVEYTHRCFPPIFPKEKLKPRRGRSIGAPSTASTSRAHIPFIGLTQACSLLRSEFRPAWLSTHKIPLSVLDAYLKAFFPFPDPHASPDAQKRLSSQFSTSGSLRIWIRTSELEDTDIIRLLRHSVRFPNSTTSMHALPDVPVSVLFTLQALISNKTERWISGIKKSRISQVRLIGRAMRVVIKERYAPQWMRSMSTPARSLSDGYAEHLGLGEVAKVWSFHFGVNYS